MPELTTNEIIEGCKLEMVSDAEREIWELVRPVLEKRIAEYKKKDFGKFTRTDSCLWSSVGIEIEVAFAIADVLEEYNFDLDDAMTDWWIKSRGGI